MIVQVMTRLDAHEQLLQEQLVLTQTIRHDALQKLLAR
jgi:hypothetical protein